jgi:serine phosphatase RsbU (regulator of sigma subunit)
MTGFAPSGPAELELEMARVDYPAALDLLSRGVDLDLHQLIGAALEPLHATDPVAYLVDFAHRVLLPMPVRLQGPVPGEEEVASTLAGRAFSTGQPVTAERDGAIRVWVPLLEGTERTGVLAVTVPVAHRRILRELALLGVFAGLAIAAIAGVSDIPHLRRRGRQMSLAATMQWELMPPLSARTDRTCVAGVLEPAYDVAGDGFDYAINGDDLHFAILDGMGHGVGSSLLTALALGAYRHARRENAPVGELFDAIEEAIAGHYAGEAFVTGVVGRISTQSGDLEWVCAGHPPPLLLRERKIVAELVCDPALPFGLSGGEPVVYTQALEPGDALLLYTDGVIEARTPNGEEFGLDRLRDLVEREAAAGQRSEEMLRRLVRAVLDHQVSDLRDDATLLVVQWLGERTSTAGEVPGQRSRAQRDSPLAGPVRPG